MIIEFKTESGSIYRVDDEAMTWERRNTTQKSGTIRAECGVLCYFPILRIGEPAHIADTKVLPGMDSHYVFTTPIVEMKRV